MSSAFAAKSTQIVAATAVVLALLGGAYAVGRSSGGDAAVPPAPTPLASVSEPARAATEAARDVAPAPVVVAAVDPRPEPRMEPRESREDAALARLCSSCGLVTDVHTETRRGQSSGVGAVGGAVVGGLLGNMVGGGNGRKLATVAGAVGGGYAGNEIEKNQKTHSVWIINVKERDGRMRRFERSNDPGLRSGDEVQLQGGGFTVVR